MVRKIIDNVADKLWQQPVELQPVWKKYGLYAARLLFRVSNDITDGHITLRAMSLVFTTLLAIVPLLAVSFSVLKGFGVHNQLEPVLLNLLAPLGEKGIEITEKIIGFVENIKVGVLGSLGLGLLFYSAISLIQKVESAFNHIWHLKHSRSMLRRVSDYLSVMVVGPVLLFTSLGLNASLQSNELVQSMLAIEPLGVLYRSVMRLLPYMLVIGAFTFFYMFIPNTRVRFKPALIGGIVSGIVWQSASWAFASFVASSTNYTAIYSGFAILLLFMIWVYLNWLILLLGADLVFHLQHPDSLTSQRIKKGLSIANKEYVALQILSLVGRYFYLEKRSATAEEIIRSLPVSGSHADDVISLLVDCGLIQQDLNLNGYFPAKPFDETSVKQALDAIRGMKGHLLHGSSASDFKSLSNIISKADEQLTAVLSQVSLKQLSLNDD